MPARDGELTGPYETAPSAQSTERSPVRRRWVARRWPYIVLPLALLVIVYETPNVITRRMLSEKLGQLHDQGAPLTLTEAAPQPVPDSQNAAVLYRKAFTGLTDERDRNLIRRFVAVNVPRPSTPRTPRPSVGQAEVVLARHDAALRLLRQASLRPVCRFPLRRDESNPSFVALPSFPHLKELRNAVRFLTAKAMVAASHGRSAEAADELATALRMSNHAADDPGLVPHLTQIACAAIVYRHLSDVLAVAPPNEDETRLLYSVLRGVDIASSWQHALQGERVLGIASFDYLRASSGPEVARIFLTPSEEDGKPEGAAALAVAVGKPLWNPFLNLDEIYYLDCMQRLITATRRPDVRSRMAVDLLEIELAHAPRYGIVTRILIPVYMGGIAARDKGIAIVGLMQAATALRAYQIDHGAYPASLAELRKAGGWAISNDPFTDKPFIYRRQGRGYLIYSVGPDLTDNGGLDMYVVRARAGAKVDDDRLKYDLVLRMAR